MMLFWISLYLLLQLGLSIWAARKTSSETDYLLAGRSLGPVAIGMSVFATWFAVEGIVTTSGVVAGEGSAGAIFDPLGLGIGIFMFAWLVAGPIRRDGHVMLTGYLGARFGRNTEVLSGIVAATSATFWSSVQLLAMAVLVASLTEWNLLFALTLSTAIVLSYTLLGGLLGDIITDMVQGAVLVVGLLVALVLLMVMGGGFEASLAAIPDERWVPQTPQPPISGLELFGAALAASIASPELAGRTLGARSVSAARNGALLGGVIYLAVGVMPVLFGLVGPQISVDIPPGDGYLPALVSAFMPMWLQVVFIGAMLSAIFSTVDSALLNVSAIAVETGYRRIRPEFSAREGLIAARLATVAAGVIAFAIAASGDSIRELAIAATSLGGCILVPILLGTQTSLAGRRGAPAAIVTGFALLILLDWVLGVPGAFIYAMGASALAYFVAEALGARLRR